MIIVNVTLSIFPSNYCGKKSFLFLPCHWGTSSKYLWRIIRHSRLIIFSWLLWDRFKDPKSSGIVITTSSWDFSFQWIDKLLFCWFVTRKYCCLLSKDDRYSSNENISPTVEDDFKFRGSLYRFQMNISICEVPAASQVRLSFRKKKNNAVDLTLTKRFDTEDVQFWGWVDRGWRFEGWRFKWVKIWGDQVLRASTFEGVKIWKVKIWGTQDLKCQVLTCNIKQDTKAQKQSKWDVATSYETSFMNSLKTKKFLQQKNSYPKLNQFDLMHMRKLVNSPNSIILQNVKLNKKPSRDFSSLHERK